jgi:hypothetical protein
MITTHLRRLVTAARAGWEQTAPQHSCAPVSASRERLRRAAAERPDIRPLLQEVEAGRMNVTEAMVQAGMRRPRNRVSALKSEWNRATEEERDEFLRFIGKAG